MTCASDGEVTLVYSVTATLGFAHTGRTFSDLDDARLEADGLRDDGWNVHIAIYGEVEGYELWRSLTVNPDALVRPKDAA